MIVPRIPERLRASHGSCRPLGPSVQELSKGLTGDSKGPASDNPQCKLFDAAELSAYVGVPLSAGRNAGAGYACQWVATAGQGSVIVAVVRADDHEPPKLAPGFKSLPSPGTEAFVGAEMGGRAAGAIDGKSALKVSIAGPKATDAMAIALLKEAISRHRRT
jgi:hypothetical protein